MSANWNKHISPFLLFSPHDLFSELNYGSGFVAPNISTYSCPGRFTLFTNTSKTYLSHKHSIFVYSCVSLNLLFFINHAWMHNYNYILLQFYRRRTKPDINLPIMLQYKIFICSRECFVMRTIFVFNSVESCCAVCSRI